MEVALVAHLLEQTGITAVTGQAITWGRRDQAGSLPALVLHRIDGERDYHLGGPSGLIASRVQADGWGRTYAEAKSVAIALAASVSGARFTRGPVRFDAILIVDERDTNFDEAGEALFRTSLDLMVHHASAS